MTRPELEETSTPLQGWLWPALEAGSILGVSLVGSLFAQNILNTRPNLESGGFPSPPVAVFYVLLGFAIFVVIKNSIARQQERAEQTKLAEELSLLVRTQPPKTFLMDSREAWRSAWEAYDLTRSAADERQILSQGSTAS